MTAGVGLLLILLGAIAGILVCFGLERWLRQPDLADLLVAVGLVVAACFWSRGPCLIRS